MNYISIDSSLIEWSSTGVKSKIFSSQREIPPVGGGEGVWESINFFFDLLSMNMSEIARTWTFNIILWKFSSKMIFKINKKINKKKEIIFPAIKTE